jgi:uncharacterized lipoprotein YmbA
MTLRIGRSAICLALLGSACASSPPTHFYTLSDIAPEQPKPAQAEHSDSPLRIDRVTIPGELDRPQLVRHLDANRVAIAEQDRWAAPLDDMIRRVLSSDLAKRLPDKTVIDPNDAARGEQVRSLSVDIESFFADAQCAITLRASWTLRQPNVPSLRKSEEVQELANGACNIESIPPTMSRALARLSDSIVASLATR